MLLFTGVLAAMVWLSARVSDAASVASAMVERLAVFRRARPPPVFAAPLGADRGVEATGVCVPHPPPAVCRTRGVSPRSGRLVAILSQVWERGQAGLVMRRGGVLEARAALSPRPQRAGARGGGRRAGRPVLAGASSDNPWSNRSVTTS
jgi:hypothetical protein